MRVLSVFLVAAVFAATVFSGVSGQSVDASLDVPTTVDVTITVPAYPVDSEPAEPADIPLSLPLFDVDSVSSATGAVCHFNGAAGHCQSSSSCTSAGGTPHAKLCRGPSTIQCCVGGHSTSSASTTHHLAPPHRSSTTSRSHRNLPAAGESCSTTWGMGTCSERSSCTGHSVYGFCAGSASVMCCVPTSSSHRAPHRPSRPSKASPAPENVDPSQPADPMPTDSTTPSPTDSTTGSDNPTAPTDSADTGSAPTDPSAPAPSDTGSADPSAASTGTDDSTPSDAGTTGSN